MAIRNTGSEQLIKDTARRIFFVEGKLHATTEDIAKEAGIPRTSVHYYFRSRDLLFKQVFNEAMIDVTKRLNGVIESHLPFRDKIENFIEICLVQTFTYPYLETFVVTEIINHKFDLPDKNSPVKFKTFLKEIKAEMDKGTLHEMNPMHFILNLFSLITYPAVAAPLYKELFGLNDTHYLKLLKERKQIIMKTIMR